MKKSAVVIFPGRGTYGKEELGYLTRYHGDKVEFIASVDKWREAQGRKTVASLDNAKSYAASKHASSINASALIYTCALADFATINRDMYDITAVCGNSLGWYLTLAAAGALNQANAIRLVDTMGALMEEQGVGGQLIYPFVDENWRESPTNLKAISEALHSGRTEGIAYLSIRLGGMAVLAPYAGWQRVWVSAISEVIDFDPGNEVIDNATADDTIFEDVLIGRRRTRLGLVDWTACRVAIDADRADEHITTDIPAELLGA